MIRSILVIFFCFLSLFLLVSCGQSRDTYEIRKLQRELSKKISEKYDIVTFADCVSMPSGVLHSFGFEFKSFHPLDRDEAVNVLIGAAQMVVSDINKNEHLLSKTVDGDFDLNKVTLTIFLSDKNPYGNSYPELSLIDLDSGIVSFISFSKDEKNTCIRIQTAEQIPLNQLLSQ